MPTNTDFRVSVGFPHHHKTKKLMRRCGPGGVLAIIYIWGHAAQNRPDGDLSGWTDEDFAIAGQWEGDPADLIAALKGSGFLEGDAGAYRLHDWATHNGFASKAAIRSEAARAKAEARWARKNGCRSNAGAMPQHSPGNAPSPSPSPSPKPSPKPSPDPACASAPASSSPTGDHHPKGPIQESMPESLAKSEAFVEAWKEWVAYRKEIRKPLKPTTIKMQIGQLEKAGPEAAVEMIRQSIFNGWTGLFEPKAGGQPKEPEYDSPAAELEAMGYRRL